MGRFSPTFLPDAGIDPLAAALQGGREGFLRGREMRRRRRAEQLADAMAEVRLMEAGVSRDTRPRPRDEGERLRQDWGPDSGFARNAAAAAVYDADRGMGRPSARPLPAPDLRRLGDTGYVMDLQNTPEARAERRRQQLVDEQAAAYLAMGLEPGEADVAARNVNVAPEVLRQRDTRQRARRLASALAVTELQNPDRRQLLAEVPELLPHELYPPERTDQMALERLRHEGDIELERLRGSNALRAAWAGRTPGGRGADDQNRAERDQRLQEQEAALKAAQARYGSLYSPTRRTRADSTAFDQDTSRIAQLGRDVEALAGPVPGAERPPPTREQARGRARAVAAETRNGRPRYTRAQIREIMRREGYPVQ